MAGLRDPFRYREEAAHFLELVQAATDSPKLRDSYLALALHASLLVAVGLLMSSITESQVVAAALSIGAFLMLWFADSVSYLLPPPFDSFAINLSLIGHFKPMVSGSVFLSDIGYFVTVSMLALFLTTWGLAQR